MFALPDYLSATPGQMGMFDDSMTVKSIDAVPFMLILPQGAPASPPVAIFQHGIDGDRVDDAAGGSTTGGAAAMRSWGIDAPCHGSRQPRRGRSGQQ